MPYRSVARQRKFHAMKDRGEISAATVKEYDKSTDYSKLPARVSSPGHSMSARRMERQKSRKY